MQTINREQAGRFMLRHQGLLGGHRFLGQAGVMDFTRQSGCVQFDPVNVCGRSAELTYLSRVRDFRPDWLEGLLYRERTLLDHFDKNLAIYPVEDWPMLKTSRERWARAGRSNPEISAIRDEVLALVGERGPQTADTLGHQGKVDWYWAPARLSRAVLEQLYYEGELLVHSKQGVLKTYDVAARLLPKEVLGMADLPPGPDQARWHLRRRVRAVGLMWRRASGAWLGSDLYYAPARARAFDEGLEAGELLPLKITGLRDTFYIAAEDEAALLEALEHPAEEPRCELLAPLDSVLWDRKLIEALFDFSYTWEIYTPPQKRVYAAYTLPILMNGRFVGRAAPVCDRKAGELRLEGLWWEEGFSPRAADRKALCKALGKLAGMNRCVLAESVKKQCK